MRFSTSCSLLFLLLGSCNQSAPDQGASNVPHAANTEQAATPGGNTPESPADTAGTYDTYCNARFGYCIEYPHGLLLPQPEAPNGDGRIFTDRNGTEILRVFGRINMDADGNPVSLTRQFQLDLQEAEKNGDSITYRKLGDTFFVISGYRQGAIFYRKTIARDDAFAYASMRYPATAKATYDPVSANISRSFR